MKEYQDSGPGTNVTFHNSDAEKQLHWRVLQKAKASQSEQQNSPTNKEGYNT